MSQKKNIPTTREVVGTSIVKVKLSERKCEAKQEFCEGWQGLFWNDAVSSDDSDYILYVKNVDDDDDDDMM